MFARDGPARLLTRHFLRRFVDNDLLSAHADRHESLGFFAATLMATGLFAAWIIGQKYVFGIPSAGLLAVMTMEDGFTFISAGMIVAALIAVTQWDVLSIDTRDAAILGPLPVRHGAIVAAKAAANAIFVLAIVAIVAVPPGVFFGLLALSPSPLAISRDFSNASPSPMRSRSTCAAAASGASVISGPRGSGTRPARDCWRASLTLAAPVA